MEASTKRTSKKSSARTGDTKIRAAYVNFILENGKRPASVYKFCKDEKISEDEFYNHFGSFDGIERAVWKTFIDKTTDRLKSDKAFSTFSAREKVLAFYYTLFEELRSNRSFVLLQTENSRKLEITPEFLKDFKSRFDHFIDTTLKAGKTNGEIAERPYLDKTYPQLFWFHIGFILFYWRDDNSPGFQNTDAAIEKSVNLAFDLIGKGAVDSAFDFAKFIYQTKVN